MILHLIEKVALAEEIETKHSKLTSNVHDHNLYFMLACIFFCSGAHIHLQSQLLNEEKSFLKPDSIFLELSAEVVGSKWSSLTALLSLTGSETEEVKRMKKSHVQQKTCAGNVDFQGRGHSYMVTSIKNSKPHHSFHV